MKQFIVIAVISCIMVLSHVGFAQEESPGNKTAIENQNLIPAATDAIYLPAETDFSFDQPNPQCQETAFAETTIPAARARACMASADYGSCNTKYILNAIHQNKPTWHFACLFSQDNHSAGGLPFLCRS